ncbi:MAG TPA: hypothetical protein VNS32_07185 [Flavisolibacter sp.]|nr:hypothetical protein [Flavisolibacter sp.]
MFSKILKAGLIVGTLDISSAFIYYFIKTGKNPLIILQFIASALLGKEQAYSGGTGMYILGLLLHYFIAFSFTIFFFLIFPKIKAMHKNLVLTGIMYGLFVWSVMNLIVVPLSQIGRRPFEPVSAIINMIILIICIGLPLSFMASGFYKRNDRKSRLIKSSMA